MGPLCERDYASVGQPGAPALLASVVFSGNLLAFLQGQEAQRVISQP